MICNTTFINYWQLFGHYLWHLVNLKNHFKLKKIENIPQKININDGLTALNIHREIAVTTDDVIKVT